MASVMLPILMVGQLALSGATTNRVHCELDQYTLKLENNVTCINCLQCQPGEGSVPQCGIFLSKVVEIGCQKCKLGKTYSNDSGPNMCQPCEVCIENQIIEAPCTFTSNTLCGKCRLGFYYDSVFSHCRPKCPRNCCVKSSIKCMQRKACMNYTGTCKKTIVPMVTTNVTTGGTSSKLVTSSALMGGPTSKPSSNGGISNLSLVLLVLFVISLIVIMILLIIISRKGCLITQTRPICSGHGESDPEAGGNCREVVSRSSDSHLLLEAVSSASNEANENSDSNVSGNPYLEPNGNTDSGIHGTPDSEVRGNQGSGVPSSLNNVSFTPKECKRSHCKCDDLLPDVFKNICQLFDMRLDIGSDCRILAGKLGFTKLDFDKANIEGNPTKEILNAWSSRKDSTILTLMGHLKNMKRHDVWKILQEELSSGRFPCTCYKCPSIESWENFNIN